MSRELTPSKGASNSLQHPGLAPESYQIWLPPNYEEEAARRAKEARDRREKAIAMQQARSRQLASERDVVRRVPLAKSTLGDYSDLVSITKKMSDLRVSHDCTLLGLGELRARVHTVQSMSMLVAAQCGLDFQQVLKKPSSTSPEDLLDIGLMCQSLEASVKLLQDLQGVVGLIQKIRPRARATLEALTNAVDHSALKVADIYTAAEPMDLSAEQSLAEHYLDEENKTSGICSADSL